MRGRFASSSTPDDIARYFDADPPLESAIEPSWNVAPTDDVHVVLHDHDARRVAAHHWGLVPPWATSPAIGSRMINARAETLADKGAFKHAYARRRCIVPADGFYEWQAVPGQKAKQPLFIHRRDGGPLALAGLWEEWRGPDPDRPQRLRSTTIVTTTPNAAMAEVHDRMPVILPPSAWEEWLAPGRADLSSLARLLVPAPADLLALRPVSTAVNDVRNDGEHLTAAVEPPTPQRSLFPSDAASGA